MARPRDYAAEYTHRLALGRQHGVSRQVARGHHPKEGGRLPDGFKASVISLREIKSGRLRAGTLETMHRMNLGLRDGDPAWLKAAQVRGWPVVESKRGGFHTQDDVPSEIIAGLTHRERQHFYGY